MIALYVAEPRIRERFALAKPSNVGCASKRGKCGARMPTVDSGRSQARDAISVRGRCQPSECAPVAKRVVGGAAGRPVTGPRGCDSVLWRNGAPEEIRAPAPDFVVKISSGDFLFDLNHSLDSERAPESGFSGCFVESRRPPVTLDRPGDAAHSWLCSHRAS